MVLKVKRLHPDAFLPTRGSAKSSGLDLYSLEDVKIVAGQTKLVRTGIAFGIPEGYEIQVRSRSGVALKTGLIVKNSPGTVDQDYVGECSVILHLLGNDGAIHTIKKHERIAQAVLVPVEIPELQEVEDLTKTDRGSSGFGSSGI